MHRSVNVASALGYSDYMYYQGRPAGLSWAASLRSRVSMLGQVAWTDLRILRNPAGLLRR